MNNQRGLSKSTYFWFFLLIASAVLLQSFQGTQANSAAMTATYSQGALHVAIPYAAGHAGTGTLAVEVLDPEDRVVGVGTVALFGLLFYGVGYLAENLAHEATDDALLDANIISIAPKVPGQVKSVPVKSNQAVKAGDLLLEIDPRDLAVTS